MRTYKLATPLVFDEVRLSRCEKGDQLRLRNGEGATYKGTQNNASYPHVIGKGSLQSYATRTEDGHMWAGRYKTSTVDVVTVLTGPGRTVQDETDKPKTKPKKKRTDADAKWLNQLFNISGVPDVERRRIAKIVKRLNGGKKL